MLILPVLLGLYPSPVLLCRNKISHCYFAHIDVSNLLCVIRSILCPDLVAPTAANMYIETKEAPGLPM